jgi:aspartate/methionine/tyrosine aminotransferase
MNQNNLPSWLPPGGSNLFQSIKALCVARETAGKKVWRLTIGQPKGPALLSAREACAQAVLSDQEAMHEYQDNGSPGIPNFSQDFVQLHLPRSLKKFEESGQIKYLPIPGIKPTLGMVILATGSYCALNPQGVATMTSPGYPTPADQCRYLAMHNYALPTNPQNHFRFSPSEIDQRVKLVMTNYPHNPSGQIATISFWEKLCCHCAEHDIRLFNDGAYVILAHTKKCAMLSEIAVDFPELSWAEAFSASKVISNGTGWRIGAIVGSADFIGDIATIKGNCDSGFFAPAAVGTLRCMQEDMDSIVANRKVYGRRINLLTKLLTSRSMKLAVKPGAGFFTLWLAPKEAFGRKIKDAEQFNYLMIEKTGVAGVHFGEYIRYAVTSPIENSEWIQAITKAFDKAKVTY